MIDKNIKNKLKEKYHIFFLDLLKLCYLLNIIKYKKLMKLNCMSIRLNLVK